MEHQLKESNNLLQYKVEVLQELIYVERCKTEEFEKKLQILKGIVIREEETRHDRLLESTRNLVKQTKNVFMKRYKEVIVDLKAFNGVDYITIDEFSVMWNKYFDSNIPFQIAQLRFINDDGKICLWLFLEGCIDSRQVLQTAHSFADNLEIVRIHAENARVAEHMQLLESQRLMKNKLTTLWPNIKENVREAFRNFNPEDIIL